MDSLGSNMDSGSVSNSPLKKKLKKDSGNAVGGTEIDNDAPRWFKAYEARQIARFEQLTAQCADTHGVLQHNIDEVSAKVDSLSVALAKAEDRIDDLENRSRINNIVIYNLPEGDKEKNSTMQVVKQFLQIAKVVDIERCTSRVHRTPTYRSNRHDAQQRPRPVHVGFNHYRDKERVKRELIRFVSSKDERKRKIFISDDLSKRVLERRKAQMSSFKALKEKGLKPFFLFPAILKAEKHGRNQPFILALGGHFCNPAQTFVVLEHHVLEQKSLVAAVDLCYKIFQIFDLQYPCQARAMWVVMDTIAFDVKPGAQESGAVRAFRAYYHFNQK